MLLKLTEPMSAIKLADALEKRGLKRTNKRRPSTLPDEHHTPAIQHLTSFVLPAPSDILQSNMTETS